MIYLDSAATAPPCPEALDAFREAAALGNPSSSHAAGLKAAELLEGSRAAVARAIDCAPNEIYFTSGGTESAAIALLGALYGYGNRPPRVAVTALEHPP
ncbi:MAG: aminotransferase class V-fold PLP-dependent enzyme, partial [Oscillospiraceae bacterium]|nr:aminotransferase class V-fold PLP-dependent enzyme [Oscillospiraceae bacterium]